MKKHVARPGGLHTDNSPVDQPKNTTRFVLNGVNENDDGESNILSTEESNEACYALPAGYIPLNDLYIGDGNSIIFSVAPDGSSSEIGITDQECNYTTLVNADFGFSIEQGVDATYRLRRGCERTIYWVDPIPRVVNIDGLNEYKDDAGNWKLNAFNLFRRYSDVPIFEDIEITEGGVTQPGGYIFVIQYLDDDLNPTEFITSTERINIYNDHQSKDYNDIRGSINSEDPNYDFTTTSKAVRLSLTNLDQDYPFYRIGIIQATSGSGQITKVEVSAEVPTNVTTFTYTGQGLSTMTLEEIQAQGFVVDQAQHIKQLESKLILSNTKGKQINYCKLQKYASRIKADLVFKEVILTAIEESNPKSPAAAHEGIGYMPGEIESFGVVYVFEDGTTTPVYHIPGRATTYKSLMSDQNVCADVTYVDNSDCDDYWGVDSEGNNLEGQLVRHHRFPLRSEVNKPLVKEDIITKTFKVNEHYLLITGTPIVLGENAIQARYSQIEVKYTVNEQQYTRTVVYDVTDARLSDGGIEVIVTQNKDEITIDSVKVIDSTVGEEYYDISSQTRVIDKKIEESAYVTDMFGIEFSGIDMPDKEDTGGHKVVGYYIVKNEKTDADKTILDTGVVVPLMEEPYFIAHGHVFPNLSDTSVLKQDAFGLIHPSHKFTNQELKQTRELLQEGVFIKRGETQKSSVRTQDVMAGTSYDPEVHKNKESDDDGFTLNILTKDTALSYKNKAKPFLVNEEIDEITYLDSLSSTAYKDTDDQRKEIFNVSADNKIGVIKSNEKRVVDTQELPYVVMKRNLTNPYSNFRYLPYYKQSRNINLFPDEQPNDQKTQLFSGDAYVAPMRYSTSFYYNIALRKRKTKSGIFNIVLAALAAAAGVVIAIGTLGLGAPVTAALVSIAAGLAFSQTSVGLKKEKLSRVYNELYEAGLRNCIKDDDTENFFNGSVPDDEVQWVGETMTNLWFETTVNIGLRVGFNNGMPDFLNAPGEQVVGTNRISDEPVNELDNYFLDKITTLDAENDNGRLYQGFANAEVYKINPDFHILNNSKIFNHLGIEYDCCSDCTEEFKHRSNWSETSFQEELVDNYRVFLPNNYRDLQGETGEITNLYTLQNNLFIHTTEALYHLPQNLQERVTGDIVSFIGTGEFFNVPPRRIVDSEDSSAGTRHKWGSLKTRNGIVFMSIDERKIYLFDGQRLHPISDLIFSWFHRNMPFKLEDQYYKTNKRKYPLANAPFGKNGTGFVSTYDTAKERFIITKKDYSLSPALQANNDFHLVEYNGNMIVFDNFQATIDDYESRGFQYAGIVNDKMKFTRRYYDVVTEERTYTETIPNKADIHVFFDESGSFGYMHEPDLKSIQEAAQQWLADFQAANPSWEGNYYEYIDKSERWLRFPERIGTETYGGQSLKDKDIVVISFVNESSPYGNDPGIQDTIPAPQDDYMDDYNDFKVLHAQYNSFIGIQYPIVFKDGDTWSRQGRGLLQQSLAAMTGRPYTSAELDVIGDNAALTYEQQQQLRSSLMGVNPYPDDGLENYGWIGKFNRNNIGSIIDATTFGDDINGLLASVQNEVTEFVDVRVPRLVYDFIPGRIDNDALQLNNSWTLSYSLKRKQWVSWHSYTPNFYFNVPGKFYSWVNGDDNIWRHNKRGEYLSFYGQKHPHIIEFVSVSNTIQTRIWEDISFQTEAQKYFEEFDEYNIVPDITFNKLLLYNSRQISGEMEIIPKNTNEDEYMGASITHSDNSLLADYNEGDWFVNGFRDMRGNNQVPMFKSSLVDRQFNYYIDKVVNDDAIDLNKPWTDMESFRDKYLSIRLIFDNFDNIKLLTKFTLETEVPSQR